MNKILIILFTLLSLLSSSSSSSSYAKPFTNNGFSIDLIHRDSPLSPFYNSTMTQTELITTAAMRSITRTSTLFNTELEAGNKNKNKNKDGDTVLIPDKGDYLMKISIGTPPVESFAVADTGSDLIWVQCLPCEQCYEQNEAIFDPKKSSTFETITCGSESCRLMSRYGCGSSGDCRYYYSYGDKSYTVGNLASDTITFGSNSNSNGGNSLNSPKTILGCGHDNDGKFKSTSTGLVGLGGGPLSLVSQFGDEIDHKFSYCLLPFSSNSTSKLKFGTHSTISNNRVVSTPLVSKPPSTYYYLTLEGVSIGGKKFKTEQSSRDIVIDSGTTMTMLESNFYNSFESSIKELVGDDHVPVQDPPEPFRLCYNNKDGSIEKLPNVTFHFDGADINLKKVNTFLFLDNLVCLSIVPSERFSIFGNLAQVNFKVGYDLKGKMVSFSPADCTME